MKNIAVVTGGAGFIGSHMVGLLLDNNYEVRVIDNLTGGYESNLNDYISHANLRVEWLDILNISACSKIFTDAAYVFHFAGIGDIVPSIEKPIDYMATNVQGTVNILELARKNNVKKFVYAASSSCYGLASTPTDEQHPIQPQYPYALSKNLGEQAVMHWHQVYGLPANSIRIFNAYGVRTRTTGAYGAVFGVFLKQKLAKKPFTVIGDGTQLRDFIYVSDVVKAFKMAAETHLNGHIWNVGGNNPQTINKLVSLIGGDVTYIPKRPGEPACTWANINKIQHALGWQPEINFDDGVAMMIDDIMHWDNAPLWTPETISKATKTWFHYLK